jgi:rubrerythrin
MKEMTKANLSGALAGESQAHIKYLAFAAQAEKEGKPNVARLFGAIAYAEQVHATNHLRELGGVGTTAENLRAAIGGETFEITEMYPSYLSVAQLQEEKTAWRSMNLANEVEKLHAVLYEDACSQVEAGRDASAEDVYVCPICGFTHVGTPPDRCPVCGAKAERFKTF